MFCVLLAAGCAQQIRVIDGDTLVVEGVRVRVAEINCPEPGEPGGAEATEFARRFIARGRVRVLPVRGRDKYGRTLARIEVAGKDLGLALIAAGLAVPYRP